MATASALSLSCSGLAILGRQALRQSPHHPLRLRLQHRLQTYILQKERTTKGRSALRMGANMPATRLVALVKLHTITSTEDYKSILAAAFCKEG